MHARRFIVFAAGAALCCPLIGASGCAGEPKKPVAAEDPSRETISFGARTDYLNNDAQRAAAAANRDAANRDSTGRDAGHRDEASTRIEQDPQFNQAAALARKTADYSDHVAPMLEGTSTDQPVPPAPSGSSPVAARSAGIRKDGRGVASNAVDHRDAGLGGAFVDPNDLSLGNPSNGGASDGPRMAGAKILPSATAGDRPSPLVPRDQQSIVNPALRQSSGALGANTPELEPKSNAISNADVNVNDVGDTRTAAAHDVPSITPPSAVGTSAIGASAPVNPVGAEGIFSRFDKRVKEYPRDVSGHLDYQLLRFLLDENVPDLASIASLPTEDRELIAAVIDGMSNFRSALRRDNNMLLSRKVRPLLDMSDRLRSQADLTVPTIALCTAVRTFGDYDAIEPRFEGGKAQDVILYCEVENFSSQIDDKQKWTTRVSKEAVLYTEAGLPVWSDKSEQLTDVSRHRRHDFFVAKKLRIPANLSAGRYLLKVSVVDQQVSRVAEATIPIVIIAAGG